MDELDPEDEILDLFFKEVELLDIDWYDSDRLFELMFMKKEDV